ncbi:hypothetical protein O7634_13735 [Micromonospora sp. WMMD1120]|uniref:hypothetical protein n=1 Tax=Micromonospora sp. WMMD1120 TaxID=3016106 RepID=UPI00241746B8|nr:hypothetical protein [Micromonospora sp. WMMD1120]MDG4807811.1 hypothetical protein [Micromonospora sp. WMMD1120]
MDPTPLLAVLAVLAAGFPLAFAIVRAPFLALVLAPLTAALSGTVAVVLMLVVGGPLSLWTAVVLVAGAGWAGWLVRRPGHRAPYGGLSHALLIVLPLLPPFLLIAQPPSQWDAHSIWWLHAGYFAHDGEYARAAIASPALVFSHTDYPPLASAPVAAVWSVVEPDFRTAQFVAALVTFSAIATLVYLVRRTLAAAPALVAWALAIAVGLACWATASYGVAGGLVDALWSATFAGAVVALLLGADPLRRPLLPLLLLTVAALTKNEGLVAAVGVAALVTVRARADLRRAALAWVPVLAGGAWAALVRLVGARSDITSGEGGRPPLVEVSALERFQLTIAALWGVAGPVLAGAAVATVLGVLFLRERRRMAGLASDGWLWAAGGFYLAVLVWTYVSGPNDIEWWLRTSVDRVALPVVLLAAVSCAGWVAVACGAGRAPTPHGLSEEPREPVTSGATPMTTR